MVATERQSRTTALTWGGMAEISLGSIVFVLSISPTAAGNAVFGPSGTITFLAIMMGLLAVAMLAIVLAPRLSRHMLQVAAIAASTVVGCLGAVAFTSLVQGADFGLLLGTGVVGSVFVARAVTRAHTLSRRTR